MDDGVSVGTIQIICKPLKYKCPFALLYVRISVDLAENVLLLVPHGALHFDFITYRIR